MQLILTFLLSIVSFKTHKKNIQNVGYIISHQASPAWADLLALVNLVHIYTLLFENHMNIPWHKKIKKVEWGEMHIECLGAGSKLS